MQGIERLSSVPSQQQNGDRSAAFWLANRLATLSETRDALVRLAATGLTRPAMAEDVAVALNRVLHSSAFDKRAWQQIKPPTWLDQGHAFACTVPWKMSAIRADLAGIIDTVVDNPGFFNDVMDSFRDDPSGPQVDLDQDLFPYFGPSMTVAIDYREAALLQGERIVMGIALSQPGKAETTWQSLMRTDPQMRRSQHLIYERVGNNKARA